MLFKRNAPYCVKSVSMTAMDVLDLSTIEETFEEEVEQEQEEKKKVIELSDIGALLSVECIVGQLQIGTLERRPKKSIPIEVAFVDLTDDQHTRFFRFSICRERKVINYRNLCPLLHDGWMLECGAAFRQVCDLIDDFRERTKDSKKIAIAGYSDFYLKLAKRKTDILVDIGKMEHNPFPGTEAILKKTQVKAGNLYDILIDSRSIKHCRNHQEVFNIRMGNYEVACVKLHILAMILWYNEGLGDPKDLDFVVQCYFLKPAFDMYVNM